MKYVTAQVGRVFAVRWHDTTVEGVAAVKREAERLHRSLGEELIYLSVTGDDCEPPTDEARRALVASGKELSDICEHFYLVLEASGFRGSTMRSVVAGLMLLSKMRGKIEVCASVDEVLGRLRTVPGVSESAVRSALQQGGVIAGHARSS